LGEKHPSRNASERICEERTYLDLALRKPQRYFAQS